MRRRTLLAAAIISGCAMEMGCSASGASSGGSGFSEGASELQAAAIKRMELATGNAWSVSYDELLGTPYHAAGMTPPLLREGMSATQAALSFFAENKDVFGMEDPAAELTVVGEDVDEYGWRHAHFQQHVGGVPVNGGSVLAHYDNLGAIRSVGAHYVKGIRQLDVNPKVTTAQALATAVRDWKANFQATLDEKRDFDRDPEINLYVYDREGRASLAWFVEVNVAGSDDHDPAKLSYWIDAKTGAILHSYNGLPTTAAKGSGVDVTGVTRALDIDTTGATAFSLLDTTRPSGKITTNNLNGGTSGAGTLYTAKANSGPWGTETTAQGVGSGVGAHYFSEMVWDYYKTMHGRDSFDGKGMAMINRVHYSKAWANASWDGTYMNYGDGDGKNLNNLTRGFDVIAHELTHGVTQKTSNLDYTGEPGGLNEGMSDIFGNLAEHWLQPNYSADVMKNPNLAIGEDVGVTKPLRYMCAPKLGLSAQKDTGDTVTASDDPHISSGVPNVAWCLMTIGGKHPSTGVTVNSGVGWDKSAKVWYLTQTKYLLGMKTATFAQAAKANSDAANELALTTNEKNIVACGWIAAKVPKGTTATCGDTTGGDGIDGGSTRGDTGAPPPPPPTDGGAADVRIDTSVPTIDATADRPPTIDTNVPETPAVPDTVTPPVEAGPPDVATVDVAADRGASGTGGTGGGGSGGTGGGGTGGTGGGGTGGTGGTGGSSGGAGSGGTGKAGSGGATGGSTRGGSAGTGGSDPGCGCEVPGHSAPVGKSTLALAAGLLAAAVSRRRRRNAA